MCRTYFSVILTIANVYSATTSAPAMQQQVHCQLPMNYPPQYPQRPNQFAPVPAQYPQAATTEMPPAYSEMKNPSTLPPGYA